MNNATHVFVVTCPVPRGSRRHLSVTVTGQTVTAVAPDGFRHEFELPQEAAADRLAWQVFGDFLEIRTPYRPVD